MLFIHTATWILFLILFYEEFIYLFILFLTLTKENIRVVKTFWYNEEKILRRKTVVVWHNTYLFKQNVCFTAYYKQVIKCIIISAYGMGSLHVLEGTMNAEMYIKVLEQHMISSRWRVFQQDNVKPHTAAITTAWQQRKIRQRRPQTLQQLETYFRLEWDQIPTSKLQKLIALMPRRLQTVLKRRGDAAPW